MISIPALEAHVANPRAAAASAQVAADAASKMALAAALAADDRPSRQSWNAAARAARLASKLAVCACRFDLDLSNAEGALACAKNDGIQP